MTYDDFNRVLNMNSNDKLYKTINNLSILSNNLQKYYNVDPLYGEINREHSNITKTNIIGKTRGEKTVESSMIFTNYMVAKYCVENNIPIGFRNHQIDPEVLKKLDMIKKKIIKEDNNADYIKYIEMVKNIYPKAYYDVNCIGHQGLGIKYYSHVTSPLRRMSDVINLVSFYKTYFKECNEETKEEVKKLIIKYSNIINKKRNSIEKFENEYEKRI